jgi:esterase/lipase
MYNFKLPSDNGIHLNITTDCTQHLNLSTKGILIHIHGFRKDVSSNTNFERRVNFFNELNIISYGLDLRGHGKSDGEIHLIKKYDDYINDLHVLVKYIKNKHVNVPIYILSESMGGAIAIIYTIKYKNIINGVILLGLMLRPVETASNLYIYSIISLSYIFPSLKIIKVANNDPISLSSGRELYYMMKYIESNTDKFTSNVLAIHSKTDSTTCYKSTIKFINTCNSFNKKIILLENEDHLFIDTNKDVMNSIYNWLKFHIK